METELQKRIRQRLEALGTNPTAAAGKVSDNVDIIRNVLNGRVKNPRADTLQLIAQALETTPEYLLAQTDKIEAPRMLGDARPARHTLPSRRDLPNDVPVRGTAAGSLTEGAFQLTTDVIDYVRRPPAMEHASTLYAIYVQGESMHPQHPPGELRFVHPDKPARIGDSVVVQTRFHESGDVTASIGHLLKRNSDVVIIGKLNPEASITFKAQHVVGVHKILDMNELFGI